MKTSGYAIRNQKVSQELSYKFVKGESDTSIMGRASFRNKKNEKWRFMIIFNCTFDNFPRS